MLMCDGCDNCFHQDCLPVEQQEMVHDGPWVCQACRGSIAMHGIPDITLDYGLTDYLFTGILPA